MLCLAWVVEVAWRAVLGAVDPQSQLETPGNYRELHEKLIARLAGPGETSAH
jgi:hypothetical protein